MMAAKQNLFVGMATFILLIVVALPVESLDDNLLFYLTFDNDTGRATTDVTGQNERRKARRRHKSDSNMCPRQGFATQWHKWFCGD